MSAPKRSSSVDAVWIEKYAVHRQPAPGRPPVAIDHMLLAEVVLADTRHPYAVLLTRGSSGPNATPLARYDGGGGLVYINEMLLDRRTRSHASADDLDAAFPDTTYEFQLTEQTGTKTITLNLGGASGRVDYPCVPRVRLHQQDAACGVVEPDLAAEFSWDPFVCGTDRHRCEGEWFADNAIYLIIDNCRGELVYSSGVVPPVATLTRDSTGITLPPGTFEPGLSYTAFLCFVNFRDSQVVDRPDGSSVQGAAVNSVAVEMDFATSGSARPGRSCPPWPVRSSYRWPGPVRAGEALHPWPVDASGLLLHAPRPTPTS